MNLNELYTIVIKEHASSEHNKHHLEHADVVAPGRNPSCGDEIELELSVKDGKILDASFTGIGCAISQASVSVMIDLIRGREVAEAKELAELFLKMSRREQLTEDELERLEEAAALQNVSNMPARIKCATMPWHTLLTAI